MIAVAGADVLRVALAENSPVQHGGIDVYFTSFLGENRVVTKVPIYIYTFTKANYCLRFEVVSNAFTVTPCGIPVGGGVWSTYAEKHPLQELKPVEL